LEKINFTYRQNIPRIFDTSYLASSDYNKLKIPMKNGRLMHSVVLFFLITACSFFTASDKSISAKDSYILSPLAPSWRQEASLKADYLFSGPAGASLIVQSFCHEFQSSSLKNLAQETFNSLDQAQVTKQNEFILQGRSALRTQGIGQLDGVKVHLTLINTKRNNCYYDFLEILPHAQTASIINELLAGITFQ
jgi:hypothetical protein